MQDLSNSKITVILPISQTKSNKPSKNSLNHAIDYETSLDSTCLSKPIISFTIKYLDRISWINDIILCTSSCIKEQIQEILSDENSDKIKYITLASKHENISISNHDQSLTQNRLLKFSLNYLRNVEQNDIIIVHDIKMPYIDENNLSNLVLEAYKNGVTCLASSEFIDDNLLFKFNETNIEEIEIREKIMNRPIRSFKSVLVDEYLDSKSYKIAYKPQAFQYSIFNMIFENCSDEDLDNDVDCLILAKQYADVRAKLVFEENNTSSFSKRSCCISHYLTENHKQVFLLNSKIDQDAYFLQSFLKSNDWNVEILQNLDKESCLKISYLIGNSNKSKNVNFVKFCDCLNELSDFNFDISNDNENGVLYNAMEGESNESINNQVYRIASFNVFFLLKRSSINATLNNYPNELIRECLKQNANLKNSWYAVILYDSFSKNMTNLLDYVFKDRNKSIIGQIFEDF